MLSVKPTHNTFLSLCRFLSGDNKEDIYQSVAQNSADRTNILIHLRSVDVHRVPVFINQWVSGGDRVNLLKDINNHIGAFMKFLLEDIDHSKTWSQLESVGWVKDLETIIDNKRGYTTMLPFNTDIFYTRLSVEPVIDGKDNLLWICELSLASLDCSGSSLTGDELEQQALSNDYLQSVRNAMLLPAEDHYFLTRHAIKH